MAGYALRVRRRLQGPFWHLGACQLSARGGVHLLHEEADNLCVAPMVAVAVARPLRTAKLIGMAKAADRLTAGQCVTTSCPAGQGLCGGNCMNISTDPLNCGSCGNACTVGQVCTAGQCSQAGPRSGGDVFACEFTVGKLAGNTIVPTGIKLTGPAGQPCSNNYGSSGVQVIAPFACAFSVGKLAGDTIVPTGISLTGPVGATCTDNYGSSGTQVPAQN